jgi:hypothetical protein
MAPVFIGRSNARTVPLVLEFPDPQIDNTITIAWRKHAIGFD